jgi:methyl-accepting chemotaxis protein
MFRTWTFGRKVGSGFAVAIAALVVVATAGYLSTGTLADNNKAVIHTLDVRNGLADLRTSLLNAETGQRGFVITGDESFLEPYKPAPDAIHRTHSRVRELTLDNPTQTRRLDAILPLIDKKLAELKQTIDQRRATTFQDVAAFIAKGEGKSLMDDIRTILTEMDTAEIDLLKKRAEDAASSSDKTKLVILGGSVAAIVLTILIGWVITRSLSSQLGSAAQHIQSSSTELQASSNQQATGAREQATAMAEIATTISELLATSRQIADSARRVSQIAGQTATAARTGETIVTKGHEATTTVRRQVDLIVGHMLELGKKSQQVGSVLDIVAELAEQTNILAINATIEAAGAGDAGRRFGVVADEIRKLADRVAGSTKEIRGMVDDVRSAVNTTVMATEAGSKAVDSSTAQVLEMASAFQQIASLVNTTTDAAREIELSTKQQATAVEQVNLAITSAAGATRETEASASQILQTASQLTELSTRLLRIVQVKAT